jgi:hypothetical protein
MMVAVGGHGDDGGRWYDGGGCMHVRMYAHGWTDGRTDGWMCMRHAACACMCLTCSYT